MKRHRAGASVGSVAITDAVVAAACTAGGGGAPGTSATQPIDHPSPSTSTAPPAVGESGRALSEEAPDATAAAEATTSDHGERPSPDGVGDPVGGTGFVSVELGVDFGCALRASGEVACWGWNNAGQASPPQGRVSVLAVGSDFACGIRVGGAVECWGNTGGWPLATPDGEFIDIASGDVRLRRAGGRFGGVLGRLHGDGVTAGRHGIRINRARAGICVRRARRRFGDVLAERRGRFRGARLRLRSLRDLRQFPSRLVGYRACVWYRRGRRCVVLVVLRT